MNQRFEDVPAAPESEAVVAPLPRELAALLDLLQRERAAIAALDAQTLRDLVPEKERAAQRLAEALDAWKNTPGADIAALAPSLHRAAAWAAANRALIDETLEALSDALGGEEGAGTYDAHARLRRRSRSYTDKRL